jgi:hypothetical protein
VRAELVAIEQQGSEDHERDSPQDLHWNPEHLAGKDGVRPALVKRDKSNRFALIDYLD